MDFKISTDIPMPEKEMRYPWKEIPVGGSFFVPAADRSAGAVCTAASGRGKRLGEGWTCRSSVEDGVKGTRVWRTK